MVNDAGRNPGADYSTVCLLIMRFESIRRCQRPFVLFRDPNFVCVSVLFIDVLSRLGRRYIEGWVDQEASTPSLMPYWVTRPHRRTNTSPTIREFLMTERRNNRVHSMCLQILSPCPFWYVRGLLVVSSLATLSHIRFHDDSSALRFYCRLHIPGHSLLSMFPVRRRSSTRSGDTICCARPLTSPSSKRKCLREETYMKLVRVEPKYLHVDHVCPPFRFIPKCPSFT